MTKKEEKKRAITFYSQKNKQVMTVRSECAKQYAMQLEEDEAVTAYETGVLVESPQTKIDLTGFRRNAVAENWLSDFLVICGETPTIVEVVEEEQLEKKRSCSERLELSRRYWKEMGMPNWKVVVIKRGETAW